MKRAAAASGSPKKKLRAFILILLEEGPQVAAWKLLSSARSRGCGRLPHLGRWNRIAVAQWAADQHVVGAQLQLLAPLRHLGVELFIGKRDALPQIDKHVRNRPVAGSRPVARIGNI